MEDLKKSLAAVGLPEKESAIYFALLHSGKASPSDLAKATRIRRTTLYQHIDTLLSRGFITKTLKGKRIFYIPENPKKIMDSFEKSKALFAQHAPQIEALYKNARQEPSIRLYEGEKGIVQILEEIGASLVGIDAFFSPAKFFAVVSKSDTNNFLKAIEKNQNVLRDLVERDKQADAFMRDVRRNKHSFHKVKLLPKDFSVSVDVLVTGNKVAMISFDNMMGLIVENAEIAKFHKSIHDFFWKNLA
jgi:sugar-specific transcriptional regulator TrmB